MHPELSFKEHDTAAFIADRLTELGIEHRPIARTGVLAWIEGRRKADPKRRAVVLRADIDALPITEQNDIGWRSCTPGVMHACGHDMHAAVLFGVLQQLAAEPDFRGTLFRAVPAGRGVQPGRCVAGAGRKPVRRVRRAGRGGRARRAATGGRDPRIPRREVHGRKRRTALRVHGTGGHGAMRPQLKDPVAAAPSC